MTSSASLAVSSSPPAGDLVLAWACDASTGRAIHISELDISRRGSRCRCQCPNCGHALVAVNVAKLAYRKRPHFRHPEGTKRDECDLLSLRAAALRLWCEHGVLDLPRRRRSGSIVGLSGDLHQAWAEVPPAQVRIINHAFVDRTTALLTLDDGRQLRVHLIASFETTAADMMPTIQIELADRSLVQLPPEELRRRLTLLPEGAVTWCSHWDDARLQVQAEGLALALADEHFDHWPASLTPTGRMNRETLLHLEVKNIIAKFGWFVAPAHVLTEQATQASTRRPVEVNWRFPEQRIELHDVALERRTGNIIPDIICEAIDASGKRLGSLMIEVTVTNRLDEERVGRLRATGRACIEFDFSATGGRIRSRPKSNGRPCNLLPRHLRCRALGSRETVFIGEVRPRPSQSNLKLDTHQLAIGWKDLPWSGGYESIPTISTGCRLVSWRPSRPICYTRSCSAGENSGNQARNRS